MRPATECCAVGEPPWDADQAMTVLYDSHYRALTRLAALLISDVAMAEKIVQDAFVTMHSAKRQLRDLDKALYCLRRTVIIRSRSHRAARASAPSPRPDLPGGGHRASTRPQARLVAALRALPARQREALALRYYTDLPETQIASVMGITTRAVKDHIACGMPALQAVLGSEPPSGCPRPP
jgi:RNA polymerase sigma factor (sigma-70 family)